MRQTGLFFMKLIFYTILVRGMLHLAIFAVK